MTEDEEILLAFLEESRENLDQLDRDLVALEAQPGDPTLLSQVFRAVHTLKGTCGFLGFPRLEALAHAGEDVLGALRDGSLLLDQGIASSLLHLVDAVRLILQQIEATGQEPDRDQADLIAELRAQLPEGVPATLDTAPVSADQADLQSTAPVASADNTVRVDVAILDKLMDLVGELVLTRSRIGELVAAGDDGPLAGPYRELRVVTADLQDNVMTARLQPIGTVIGKFHRIARDLAAALGKQVSVVVEGEEVGVDKAVNEALRDPLLHLVRNALDHGIETPAERAAAGKPRSGMLRIRAYHEGGRVHVDVSDDGRGVDAAGLRDKAVRAGLLTADDAATLSDAQTLDLMFRAGLSTRDEVTSTSGRGVGMDVVRTALEAVGGSIDVDSTPGSGVRFRLNVPLTLAIMPVLVAVAGGERYALPQVHLREITHLNAAEVNERVDVVDNARLLRLRGRLLPLVDLAERLGTQARREDGGVVVVVVELNGRVLGLIVDDVDDTVDVVVKPLPRLLRSISVFAGTTILSDGRPTLILDIAAVAGADGGVVEEAEVTSGETIADAALLLATSPDGGRLAVRIERVRRLESFPLERIEHTGELDVVQYGEEILPLVRVADLLPERRSELRDRLPVSELESVTAVVCETSVGPVGFVVNSIDDIVAEPSVPSQPSSRAGVEACVVVGDRLAELLDLEVLTAQSGIGRRA
ncbi:MAG: chemotaxis protein CheW [Mycobacteriales bacterium]